MERVQAGDRLRGAAAHRVVDPVWAIRAHVGQQPGPVIAERVEERLDGGFVASLSGPHEPAGVVVDDDGDVALALAVRQLVDPDAPQPVEHVPAVSVLGHDPLHDGGHRPLADPKQLRHHRRRRMRRQPAGLVLERPGETGFGSRPWHRRDDHTVDRATHPTGISFEERPDRPQVQRPPSTPPPPAVMAPASTPAARAATCPRPRRAYLYHQHRLGPLTLHATCSITACSTPSSCFHTLELRTPPLRSPLLTLDKPET